MTKGCTAKPTPPSEWGNPSNWKGIIPYLPDLTFPTGQGGRDVASEDKKMGEFANNYATDVGNKLQTALKTKGAWIANPPCGGFYAFSAVRNLLVATQTYIDALNAISNHDTGAKPRVVKPAGNKSFAGPSIGAEGEGDGEIDLFTFIAALTAAESIGETEAEVNQDPQVAPETHQEETPAPAPSGEPST